MTLITAEAQRLSRAVGAAVELAEGDEIVYRAATGATEPYAEFRFAPGDVLLLGRESSGVPEAVHRRADARITIPMAPGRRSLNVAVAAAMVLGEALRQTGGFPPAGEKT